MPPVVIYRPDNFQSVAGTDPAAGSEISEAVPANRMWEVFSIRFALVTDSTTPVRTVQLQITDGTNVLWRFPSSNTQAASATTTYAFVAGLALAEFAASADNVFSLPSGLILPAAYTIETLTDAIVSGDNYGAPRLFVYDL